MVHCRIPTRSTDHLAHHFETSRQQRDAATLGMWLFLATEVLLFGGLFCVYAVFRHLHPELFEYGSRFLDTGWGAINTAVLIVSSFTMAMAVRCAQCGHRSQLVLYLGLTLMCAGDFLGIKYIEYRHKLHENLVWGERFYEPPPGYLPASVAGEESAVSPLDPGDSELGRAAYRASCAGCHGARGEGLANFGAPLTTSSYVRDLDDDALVAFLERGRPAHDPLNRTGIAMLPRGGNPRLSDQDLVHIVAYVRDLQMPAGGEAGADETEFTIPRSVIPDAADAPSGLVYESLDWPFDDETDPGPLIDPRFDPERPENTHLFFGIYFMMTGLHGVHVLVGMIVIGWLLIRSVRGDFSGAYYTPVDLGGLYWHIVDLIWIFLFPLLYLIG